MLFALVLGVLVSFQSISLNNAAGVTDWQHANSVYDFTVRSIKGEEISMKKYDGLVLIIVNVASECGYTSRHYEELNNLMRRHRNRGLRILAFPCNQFGGQEPGDAKTISEFAAKNEISFELFAKINVNGPDAHPLWKYLKSKIGGLLNDDIKWNFTKFVVDRSGQPVERFAGNVSPAEMERDIDKYF